MNYTGRQVLVSVREREDGQWRYAVWMRDDRAESDTLMPFQEAWKGYPLRFDGAAWQVQAVLQDVVRYVKDVNERRSDQEDADQLDLWSDV